MREKLTAEVVKKYFSEICLGEAVRYEVDYLKTLNFVLRKSLGGGGTRSLAVDKHGKTMGMALHEISLDKKR